MDPLVTGYQFMYKILNYILSYKSLTMISETPRFFQWPILEPSLISVPLSSSKSEGKQSKKNEKFSLAKLSFIFLKFMSSFICIKISCLLLRFFKIQNKMNIVILIESKQWNKVMLCFQTTWSPASITILEVTVKGSDVSPLTSAWRFIALILIFKYCWFLHKTNILID